MTHSGASEKYLNMHAWPCDNAFATVADVQRREYK